MSIKYQIDRKKFVSYYPVIISKLADPKIIMYDLIAGGEFILTAEDILNQVLTVPTRLLVDYQGIPGAVLASECEFKFVQDEP